MFILVAENENEQEAVKKHSRRPPFWIMGTIYMWKYKNPLLQICKQLKFFALFMRNEETLLGFGFPKETVKENWFVNNPLWDQVSSFRLSVKEF